MTNPVNTPPTEPEKINPVYTLNCDICGKAFKSNKAFPKPHICPTCYV